MPVSQYRSRSVALVAGAAVACALGWPGAGAMGIAHAQVKTALPMFAAPSAAITSFKATLDIAVPGSASSPATNINAIATVVMPKGNLEFSATADIASGSTPLSIDLVYDGKQLCTRMAAGTPWSCMSVKSLTSSLTGSGSSSTSSLSLGGILGSLLGGTGSTSSSGSSSSSSSFNPLTLLGTGASFGYKLIGNGVTAGKPSTGYSFSANASLGALSGTIWFERPDGRLLSMAATGSVVTTPKAAPQTISVKLTVSNYNDPTLKIPVVKNGQP
jgi:hypothetical protein